MTLRAARVQLALRVELDVRAENMAHRPVADEREQSCGARAVWCANEMPMAIASIRLIAASVMPTTAMQGERAGATLYTWGISFAAGAPTQQARFGKKISNIEKNFPKELRMRVRKAVAKTQPRYGIAQDVPGRLPNLGRHLGEIRRSLGLTLKEIEKATGIAASTLSKVQNGQASLSYENLVRLANGLGIEVAHLFTSRELDLKMGRRAITIKGQGRWGATDRYSFELLCSELYNKHMNPGILEITARTLDEAGGLSHHDGEEFIYVLAGPVEIHYEDYQPVRLETGDALYLDSASGHAYVSVGKSAARILAVTTSLAQAVVENLAGTRDRRGASQSAREGPGRK